MIKLGNDDRPASKADLDDVREIIRTVMKDTDEPLSIVTHNFVEFEDVPHYPGCAIVYMLGTNDCPASSEDIENFQKELAEAHAEKRPVVAPHHVKVKHLKLR